MIVPVWVRLGISAWVIGSGTEADVPPPGAGVMTLICWVPTVAR